MMHKDFQYKFAFCLVLISIFILSSCKESNSPLQSTKTEASIKSAVPLVKENVRPEVELSLMKLIDALKAKDLTLYARNIPENFQFRRAGMNLDRKEYLEWLEEEWRPIIKTNFYELSFGKFEIKGDEAHTKISTRWERQVKNKTGQIETHFSTYEEEAIWKMYNENSWQPQFLNSNERSFLVDGIQKK